MLSRCPKVLAHTLPGTGFPVSFCEGGILPVLIRSLDKYFFVQEYPMSDLFPINVKGRLGVSQRILDNREGKATLSSVPETTPPPGHRILSCPEFMFAYVYTVM